MNHRPSAVTVPAAHAARAQHQEWNIEENTLLSYIGTDNGGGISKRIFNSGLKGGKNSVTLLAPLAGYQTCHVGKWSTT